MKKHGISTPTEWQADPHIVSEVQKSQELLAKAQMHNSPSNYVRPTSALFPYNKSTYYDAKMPFALVIQPMGPTVEQGFPEVSFGNNPILRCDNCRAYINPFMTFHADGEDIRCNLCLIQNRLPSYFVKPLMEGVRSDYQERADLHSGSFDIRAGQEYQARAPMPPTYFFMIDVSQRSQGILGLMAQVIKEFILSDKITDRTMFGLLTFDSSIHLYSFNSKLKQAQMFVMSDQNDTDYPIPEEWLYNIKDSTDIIIGLLDQLDKMFTQVLTKPVDFMSALKTSHRILSLVGGKLFIISSNFVNELEGKVDNNKNYILPSTPILSQMCAEMHLQYICPSIFVIPHKYSNLITLNELVKYLNGDMFYYDDPNNLHKQFYYDFKNVLFKDYVWEAVFRIRTSLGWRIRQTYGNYSIKQNDLLSVTCIEDTKTLTYELELINPTARTDVMYIQSALLYTSTQGQRRIRIHNYCIPLVSSVQAIYDQGDPAAISAVLMKLSLYKFYKTPQLNEIQQFIMNAGRGIIQTARAVKSTAMEPLHQYLLGIMKHQLMNNKYTNSITTDVANLTRGMFNFIGVDELMIHFVPQLYRLDDIKQDECIYEEGGYFIYPQLLPLTLDEINKGGIFLMDYGKAIYIYITSPKNEQLCKDIFGQSYQESELTEDMLYSNSNNPINDKLCYLIHEIRINKFTKYAPITVIKQGSRKPAEKAFLELLIYDDLHSVYRQSYAQFVKILS